MAIHTGKGTTKTSATTGGERSGGFVHLAPGEERTRFGLTFLAIVAAFAVQGIAESGRWQQFLVAVLLAITLVLAFWVGRARRPVMTVAVLVAGLLVVLSLVEALVGKGNGVVASIANLLLVILAPPMIIVGVLRTLRSRGRVTFEALFGGLCVYMLLGMFFAFVYGVIGHIDGHFFASGVTATTSRDLYFSFTTLTTVGYGDLTATSNLGHTLSVTEALIGQIYLVTVVSVIVANLGRGRTSQGGA